MMKKSLCTILVFLVFSIFAREAFCFWIWSPKTKKITNPKAVVQHSPVRQFAIAVELYNSKEFDGAIKEFKSLLEVYPKAEEAAEALYYLGRIYEDTNKSYEAYKNYQKVIDKYPFSKRLNEIIEREYNIARLLMDQFLSKKSSVIWQEIAGKEYTPIEIFRAVILNSPYGEYAAISQYQIGIFLREISQFDAAVVEFQKVIDEYPQSEWAEAARYQIALTQADRSLKPEYDQETTKEAIGEFKDFIEAHPDLKLSEDADKQIERLQDKEIESNFRIAEFYEKQKQHNSAKIYYQEIIDNFPHSRWANKAEERLEEIRRMER